MADIQAPPPSAGVLGQGVKYPPTLDTSTGRLALSWGPDVVTQAIQSIAQTQASERPMLPGYGASTIFEPTDSARIAITLDQNIADYEPRAVNVNVEPEMDPRAAGGVIANISYSVLGEATIRTLTYPVFTGPATTGASE